MDEKLVGCFFFIPVVRDSDRQKHPPVTWRDLQDAIFEVFPEGHSGPVTWHRAVKTVSGQYVDQATKKVVHDESRQYIVAIPRSRLDDLRGLLRRAANTFDQKMIYLDVAGAVEFVEGRAEDGFL